MRRTLVSLAAIAALATAFACSSKPNQPPLETMGANAPSQGGGSTPGGSGSSSGGSTEDGGAVAEAGADAGPDAGSCLGGSCTGCCTATQVCVGGNLDTACGLNGTLCQDCTTSSTHCNGQQCQ